MVWNIHPLATLISPVTQQFTATENSSGFCGTLGYSLTLISGKLDVIKFDSTLRIMTIDHRALPLRTNQNPELYDSSYVGSHELKLTTNIVGSIAYPIIPIPA
jgi:hypothetical protein